MYNLYKNIILFSAGYFTAYSLNYFVGNKSCNLFINNNKNNYMKNGAIFFIITNHINFRRIYKKIYDKRNNLIKHS